MSPRGKAGRGRDRAERGPGSREEREHVSVRTGVGLGEPREIGAQQ